MWPPKDIYQLMRRIEEYKKLEDNRLQGKGKALAMSQYRREYCIEKFQPRARRESKAPRMDWHSVLKG